MTQNAIIVNTLTPVRPENSYFFRYNHLQLGSQVSKLPHLHPIWWQLVFQGAAVRSQFPPRVPMSEFIPLLRAWVLPSTKFRATLQLENLAVGPEN